MTDTPNTTPPHPGAVQIGDRWMLRNDRGGFDPLDVIRPDELLEDQTVRRIIGFARDLEGQIARFKGHTFDDIWAFLALIREQYGASRGGRKGNLTLTTHDRCQKVQLRVADRIVFGPQLQVARDLVDQCIATWAEGSRTEIRALVDSAFNTDKEGMVDRAALLRLRRLAIADPIWRQAMDALTDSIRTEGTTTYMAFSLRAAPGAPEVSIRIDLAAVAPASAAA